MENRDEKLWQLATQRAKFKGQIFTYIAVNIFLWTIWLIKGSNHHQNDNIPWPAWVTIGWGFGLVINYVRIYHFKGDDAIQKEYEKLTNKG